MTLEGSGRAPASVEEHGDADEGHDADDQKGGQAEQRFGSHWLRLSV
jgi:hypothetical protein